MLLEIVPEGLEVLLNFFLLPVIGKLELIFQIHLIQPILREPSGQLSSGDRLLGVVPQHIQILLDDVDRLLEIFPSLDIELLD